MLTIISLCVGYATVVGQFPGRSRAFAAPIKGLSLPSVSSSVPTTDQDVVRPPAINRTTRSLQVVTEPQPTVTGQLAAAPAAPAPSPTATPADAAQEGAAVRAAAVASPPDIPPYQIYQVVENDTVSTIAAKFGVTSEYILANNAELQDGNLLTLGQSIIVPAGNGMLHEVRYGETLSDIADRYEVPIGVIQSFGPNHISAADDITETQLVFVPNGKPPAVAAAPDNTSTGSDAAGDATPTSEATGGTGGPGGSDGAGSSSGDSSGGGGTVSSGPSSGHGLMWPLVGPISSYYGPSHPLGIDIDGYNLAGAAVGAATSGTVTFAGGNSCCSYGLYVVVVSPGGIETLYAHLSSISVTQGETVSQGEALGIIGSTGYSTGRHLHFEVIDNGTRVNPLSYLP